MMQKIIILIVLSLLAGCSADISPSQIDLANELCLPNGGLDHLESYTFLGMTGLPNVHCNNGAVFKAIDIRENHK